MNYETQVDCHGILARDHSKKKKLADITRWETFSEFPIEFIIYPRPKYGGFHKYGGTPKSSSISNDGIFPHNNHPAMVVATPMTSWNPPKDQRDHVLRPAVTPPTVTVSVPPGTLALLGSNSSMLAKPLSSLSWVFGCLKKQAMSAQRPPKNADLMGFSGKKCDFMGF